MNWLAIEGKVVIVTGGSSGIGLAIVTELCELGCKVVNADLETGNFTHENLLFVKTDVSSRTSVEAMLERTIEAYDTVDAVVNNAGINMPALLADAANAHGQYELNDAVFDKIVAINQKGVYLVSQAVGRILTEKGSGVIINMSSESGLEGSEGQSAYAATKAAINSFTRSWAKELGKKGVRVVGIAPGIMEETGLRTLAYETALAYTRGISVDDLRSGYSKTSTIPLGRSGKLAEVADLVAYFVSDRSSYISGVTVNIAGGKTRG
ncbi:sorbitol-6-phosphate 2-dehydrogenase [Enterococcus sp. PF1-24]|uniref:SDR family oxidoreductase n=1 Tax=unclassified Enterococcus TaxID=2608891 RepID=UPI002475914C|nr:MULTISPECIES: SDR family oxidoreductase [unclassified Enterococcus]MDH6364909.1 sorbitol-6-phosphate 2-dehydrogenase [Enterococcus sp. PFB1-1]MDH6402010.1 sorbitol-6-phosphate 2-dehydrogenase [Enterococcus sp. PF1-24]